MRDDHKMSREQRIEMYRRLAAAGTRGSGSYQKELISAARQHDIEMLDALHGLGVDIHDPVEEYEEDSYDDDYGARSRIRKRSYNLLLIAAREKNRDMIDYLAAKGLLAKYALNEQKQAISFNIEDASFTEFLLQRGLPPSPGSFAACLQKSLPAAHVKLFLDYGLSLVDARREFSGVIGANVSTAEYIAEIADLLKLPPAKKPVLTPPAPKFPIEVETPAAERPSADEVVIERPFLNNRRIMHVFNFVTRERTSAVRRDEFSPVESIETRQFHELRDHPDLLQAHDEHLARGGRVSENDLYRAKKPISQKVVL